MKLTSIEWKLMNAVWKGHPVTARGVAERLKGGEGWAYTTIKTMLTRLVSKGALRERKEGKTSLYEPLLTRKMARAKALGALAVDAFDGAFANLLHFLVEEEEMSPKERKRLVELLQETRKREEAKR